MRVLLSATFFFFVVLSTFSVESFPSRKLAAAKAVKAGPYASYSSRTYSTTSEFKDDENTPTTDTPPTPTKLGEYFREFSSLAFRTKFIGDVTLALSSVWASLKEYQDHRELYMAGTDFICASYLLTFFILLGVHPAFSFLIKIIGLVSVFGGLSMLLTGFSELKSNASLFLVPRVSIDSNSHKNNMSTVSSTSSRNSHTPHAVVTSGIYNYSRHPIYAGLAVLCMGVGIVNNSAERTFLAVLLGYVVDQKANIEEGFLLKTYPDEYAKYMRSTNKMIPFVY